MNIDICVGNTWKSRWIWRWLESGHPR